MGFRLQRTYALRWDEGTDLAGLEIDMTSTSVATLMEVKALKVGRDEARLGALLADHVKSWNLEDENGETLPISAESLYTQEAAVLAEIAKQWYLAAAGVSAPLALGSTSSATSVEESIPMETL
jgi:hypothetical protein